jgi:hypothetical protein
LAGQDNNLVDGSGSFFLQELTDHEASKHTGTDNGEVLVSRHVLAIDCYVSW